MPPFALALSSFALMLGAWLHYLASIPREKVPAKPRGHAAAMVAAIILGGLATVETSGTTGSIALAASAMTLALFFFYLLRQAPLPDGELAVAVGEPLPLIEAKSSEGVMVRSTEWAGERVLFKFFRGHW